MISKTKAKILLKESKRNIELETLEQISKDEELSKLFDWIETLIRNAVKNGNSNLFWYQSKMYELFPFTKTNSEWYTLIQRLGYKIRQSYSTSSENEKYYLKI